MTKATITFEDDDVNNLDMKIDFGEGGPNKDSIAHVAAAKAYVEIAEFLKAQSEGESSEYSE
jgi:hypothetical protein